MKSQCLQYPYVAVCNTCCYSLATAVASTKHNLFSKCEMGGKKNLAKGKYL